MLNHFDTGVEGRARWGPCPPPLPFLQCASVRSRSCPVKIEADETYIGGLARDVHRVKRDKKVHGTGGSGSGKVAVMGLLERDGKVRAKVIRDATQLTLHAEVRSNVEPGAELFTDGWKGYGGLHADYIHQVIDHAEKYVDGQIHTNGIENFWSLLKRGLKGTYVSVEPFHLFRYLDEQSFRFNNRKLTDGEIGSTYKIQSSLSSV